MKKVLIVLGVVLSLAVGLLVFTSRNSTMAVHASYAGESQQMEKMCLAFMEDIQFKDFQKAASYHSVEDRKKADVPAEIQHWFGIRHETLNIMRYDIVKISFDSSGKRCRVLVHTVFKVLNANEIRELEIMLYWFKDPAEGWVMDLDSSLH
jgi:hypothetical protein